MTSREFLRDMRNGEVEQAKRAYKRALERGFVLSPKQATLEQYGLTEWWEEHKAQGFENLSILDRVTFKEQAEAKERRQSNPLYRRIGGSEVSS